MEKRNNKKLFAIIGGSVLAFVLTIALSVSITLAYFGSTVDQTMTVTMDAAVTVGHSWTASQEYTNPVLPGEGIKVDATATVTAGETGAFLAAKVEVTENADSLKANTFTLKTGSEWQYDATSGYIFYVGSTTGTPAVLTSTTGLTQKLEGSYIVSAGITNETRVETLKIKVTFVAVQGKVFDETTGEVVTATFENVAAMMDDVA